MTSLACWLVVVDNVFSDVAAAWALLTPNYGGGRFEIALGKDVKDVIIQRTFAGLAGVGAAVALLGSGCLRPGSTLFLAG